MKDLTGLSTKQALSVAGIAFLVIWAAAKMNEQKKNGNGA